MELAIDPGPEPGTYAVRVLRSLSGDQPSGTIQLDVDALIASVPGLEASVLASSVSSRRVMTERETAVQAVGAGLFGAVFSGPVESAYRASAAVAAERGRSLQLALRLNAPGLAAIPWETLFDPAAGAYLSRKEPILRWVPGPHDPDPTDLDPPLRILGMIAAPRGLPVLDVEAEQRRLEEALRPQIDAGRVELTWLAEASWHGIQNQLLTHPWHVLHFVGHGGYDVATDEGLLALVGGDGRADYVSASRLADLLDEAEPTPRLVVLNSCQSAPPATPTCCRGRRRPSCTAASTPSPPCSSRSPTPLQWRSPAPSTPRSRAAARWARPSAAAGSASWARGPTRSSG